MSQSDYLQHIKLSNQLVAQTDYPRVLNAQDLSLFKKYSLENSISNTKIQYSQLALPNTQNVFGIEKQISNCPSFILCKNTNTRPNRKLNTYVPPVPHPLAPLYMKKVNPSVLDIRNTNYCKCNVNPRLENRKSKPRPRNTSFPAIFTVTTKIGQKK